MDNNSILQKLDGLEARFEEVSTLITDPDVIADQNRFVKLTKEYKDLGDIMNGLEWLENGVEGNEMSSPRSMEIELWLRYRKDNIANYVILDDLPMPSTLQQHFVQINPVYGLLNLQAEQAIKILNV